MNKLLPTSACVFACGIFSCERNKESFNNEPQLTRNTLTQTSVTPDSSAIKDEWQENATLPIDSIQIVRGKVPQVVYGRRRGDKLLVEGDMVFEYIPAFAGVGATRKLWTLRNDTIRIPYRYNFNVTKAMKEKIIAAMNMWKQVVPVLFTTKSDADKNYIEFVKSDDTSSSVGRSVLPKKQSIELKESRKPGNIAHEIGHALGMYHEQNRSDRDSFVIVSKSCSKNKNYIKALKKDPNARDFGPYNYYSIMHYSTSGCMSIKASGLPTGTRLPKGIPGQRRTISPGDVLTIDSLYGYTRRPKGAVSVIDQ